MAAGGPTYKIKLANGRILGPLDLERVRLLVSKNQVVGTEVAREYPKGDWKDINLHPKLAEILIASAEGRLEIALDGAGYQPILGADVDASGATQVLESGTELLPISGELVELPEIQAPPTIALTDVRHDPPTVAETIAPKLPAAPLVELTPEPAPEQEERTRVVGEMPPATTGFEGDDEEKTRVVGAPDVSSDKTGVGFDAGQLADAGLSFENPSPEDRTQVGSSAPPSEPAQESAPFQSNISNESTVIFQRSLEPVEEDDDEETGTKTQAPVRVIRIGGHRIELSLREFKKNLRKIATAALMIVVAHEFLFVEDAVQAPVKFVPIRPRFVSPTEGGADPQKSQAFYNEAMKEYIKDTALSYRHTVELLHKAASADVTNVQALAMLASTYINLIDSSNKDADYFAVISKLIEMSRAKKVDLPETVIADVEFYVVANKAEAAQNRIVEYTKTHDRFGPEMFFFLSYAFYARNDFQSAARYASQIPDNKVYSARIFHHRGKIAEALGDPEAAHREYEKALKLYREHAPSALAIANLQASKGKLKDSARFLDFLVTNPNLLGPKDLARAYYLHAQLNELYQKWHIALGDVERAVRLDKDNHDYLLELYTLRAKVGDSIQSVQKEARMYFFLGEGEKLLKDGRTQDALVQFLQAREANLDSHIPLTKIGDMFYALNDMGNAMQNYKIAAQKAQNNIEVWGRYIKVLIQSYEWDEANKAMDKFRRLPVSQSVIDKAAGDMYARQGRHVEAQMYYKKAMARDSIDPEVYIAFARSLMAGKNFRDAPFFFALALRFDPLNIEALIGTSKCIAALESIDRGISMLQDELQKSGGSKAELLAAIAEFQIQKGEWVVAQQYVDQSTAANSDYAYPWKLQAQIYMNREGLDRDALDKALAAYKSYSDRNTSDPSGYLERYRVYIKKTNFEKAEEELNRIYGIYPKYPNLHYYRGVLYATMGNHRLAAEHFQKELLNNAGSVQTMIALGKELLELQDAKSALDLFNRAMQIAPTNPEAKHQSAYANFLLKNYQGAVALYQAALAYDKGNPTIYKRMGMAYRAMGDGASARLAFRKYLEMEPDAPDKAEFE